MSLFDFDFDALQKREVITEKDVIDFREALVGLIPDLADNGSYVIPRGARSFWAFYRANKAVLRRARVFVYKAGGDWVVSAHPLCVSGEERALERALSCWRERLRGCCGVGFLEMKLLERVLSNGVKRYVLFCPVCELERTSGLPFVVVRHLERDFGMSVVVCPREVSP